MRTHLITDKDIDLVEGIIMKLESLSALATVCGSAFITEDSFSNLNPREVHQTFNNIHSQLDEAVKDVNMLLVAIYGDREKEGVESE